MAKFCGTVGYAETFETSPGVWESRITERRYFGDVIRSTRHLQTSGQLNDNVNVSNEISIVADPYAMENFHAIRYVEFMGSKWKVSSAEVSYPRLILTVGDLYNEQTS
ncbi:MAG: hypothetical protein NC120_07190 [Ruminococcus sp.]|nr:hypothetical protein [Ruminococcus sp.]